jgi:hypothetical protein
MEGAVSAKPPDLPFPLERSPGRSLSTTLDGDGNPDLLIIPYERDIAEPSQNAVTVLLGDGKGSFKPMPGSPLPLGGCHGADSVTTGDLLGEGRHDIAVACAESRNLTIFARDSDGHFHSFAQAFKGGWGAVAFGHLTDSRHGELITANNEEGTITIFFPD